MIRWQYKTIHFDLKKDGILGSPFLDEEELERGLCRHGQDGWELVAVLEVQDGLVALCKQPFSEENRAEVKPVAVSIQDTIVREEDDGIDGPAGEAAKTVARRGGKTAIKPPKPELSAAERSPVYEDEEEAPPGPNIDSGADGDEEGSGLSSIKIE